MPTQQDNENLMRWLQASPRNTRVILEMIAVREDFARALEDGSFPSILQFARRNRGSVFGRPPSFAYFRKRVARDLWRKLHRFTVIAYVLSLVHAIGAGTDASTVWLRTFMVATAVPIGVMFVARMIPRRKPRKVKGSVRVGRPEAEPAA